MNDNDIYVFASVTDLKREREYMFLMSPDTRSEATKIFKELDAYKKTLSIEDKELVNFHIWGGIEITMLRASGAHFRPASSPSWIIERCKEILAR